ncbi:peptidase domain-containing ABC transporter [Phyllobacterium phragmitis]|nr:type I secretion system permease/ATPase [Phyllobacterium phragmitis]
MTQQPRQFDTADPVQCAGPAGTPLLLGCILILASLQRVVEDQAAAQEAAVPLLEHPAKSAGKAYARALGLRAVFRRLPLARLDPERLPLAFRTGDGGWRVLARLTEEHALVLAPGEQSPVALSPAELAGIWSGEVLEVRGSGTTRQALRPFDITWFIPEFLRYRGLAIEVMAASAMLELMALLMPLFFQVVMDKVIFYQAGSTLDVLVTVLVLVAVLEVLLKCVRQYIASQTTTRIDARLGARLFDRLMDLPISYFQSRSTGMTVMRLRELDTIREFLSGAANTLLIDLGFTLIFFAVMYLYSPLLTAIVAASVPCYFTLAYLTTPRLQRRIEEMFRDGAINNAFLTETLTGVETVKALALEPQLIRRWESQTQNFVTSNFLVQRLMQVSGSLVAAIQRITLVLVLWVGARMVIGLELSIGQLIAFNMMAAHVSEPITRLAELWRDYVQARVSIDRLGDVLDTPAERSDTQPGLPEKLGGGITFEAVRFAYAPHRPPVLEDFSLDIPAGSMVAFVGASGSGKSTVARLIQKLYLPSAGRIRLDGIDLAGVDAVALRKRMSVVLQENYLFNRSVRENIALRDPAALLDQVIGAARLAGAHEFILELKDGYDTVLAEGGASLSGGQRQRIAIARAVLNDPAVLILDEATSALDDESQERVKQGLERIRAGRTVIMIAHRLSTVRDCDRIFVLDNGRIVEAGSPRALLAHGGAYARLCRLQTGETGRARDTSSAAPRQTLTLGRMSAAIGRAEG